MSIDAEASHRSALWLSMALTLLGSCGACNGMNTYSAPPVQADEQAPADARPGAEELVAFVVTLRATFVDAPNRRPLALANVVCSLMLIAGGFMLGTRRSNARWFITNALVANVAWIAADSTISVLQLQGWREALVRKLIPYIHAATPPGGPPNPYSDRVVADATLTMGATIILFAGFVKIGMHLWILRRAHHPAITAFLEQPPEA